MPTKYEIDQERRLVAVTAWGACSAKDVLQFRKQVLSDENFDPSFSQLADFRNITKVNFSPDDVRMLAAISPFSPRSRRALVAGDNNLVFGLCKMFSILRSLRGERHIRVFRDYGEAMSWLMEKEKAA